MSSLGSIRCGDTVKWTTSRKPLGVVVHVFMFKGWEYAVVEGANNKLSVVRIYELLEVVKPNEQTKPTS